MNSIKARVTFDEASHLIAFRLHMWHRYQVWLMLRGFFTALVFVAGIILVMTQGFSPMSILFLMVGTFALLRPVIWKMMHARNLRGLDGYGQEVVYTFTPEKMSIHGETQSGEVTWGDLLETKPTKKGVLFYHEKKSYTWIPRDSFDSEDDMQQVIDWAK